MRICFIATAINTKTGGGSHRNIVAIIRALREMGHTVTVHTAFDTRHDPPSDIELSSHHGEGLSFLAFGQLVTDLLNTQEGNTDLFFVYGHALLWGAGKYRMRGKVPTIVYIDNYLDTMPESMLSGRGLSRIKHRLWERFVGRRYLRVIDRFLFVSDFLRGVYTRVGFPRERASVIPNFFELTEQASVVRDGKRILYAGRLSAEKGTDVLLQALDMLPKSIEWQAHIAGDGTQRDIVEAYARKDSRVVCRGWLSNKDLALAYAEASVFVHPTRWAEPFGRTIVEAMHASLPIIVPAYGGAADIAGDAALTFQNGDAASLSKAIATLLEDPLQRNTLAQRGIERAQRYSKAVVVPTLLSELEAVAGRKASH